MEIKLCVDCKWLGVSPFGNYLCTRTKEPDKVDPVDGSVLEGFAYLCKTARKPLGSCGPSGKYWERKAETSPTKTFFDKVKEIFKK